MAESFTLRAVTADDLEALFPLQELFYAADPYSVPFDGAAARRAMVELTSDARLGRVWLVRCAGELIGYIAICYGFSLEFRGRDAYVDEFFLLPAWRGRGWGAAILAEVEAAAQAEGIRAMHLEVHHANRRVASLYERAGYQPHASTFLTKAMF